MWYKRAIEYHFTDPNCFIYSVPFDVGEENTTLLTVSHAIFREDEKGRKAPAAVTGYQSYHSALYLLFRSITKNVSFIFIIAGDLDVDYHNRKIK